MNLPIPATCWRALASAVTLVLSFGPGTVAAQSASRSPSALHPSFEQVVSLRGVGALAISPDGRSIVFAVRTTEWEANRFDTELWLAREGEQPFQLTRTDKQSSVAPRWSPDGRWIAFLADRGGKQQVWLISPSGGEAQLITNHKEGISSFRWSPDGKRIAFTAQEPESEEARKRKERFGDFAVEDAEYRQSHLWTVEVVPDAWPTPAEAPCPRSAGAPADTATMPRPGCAELPKPVRLTGGDTLTVTGFEWSPDGMRIVFGHQRDPLINSWPTADISLLEVATKQVRPLVTTPGSDGGALWSPDGRWIVYGSSAGDTTSSYYLNQQLFRIPANGGTPVRIAADLDESIGSLTWTRTGLYGVAWQGAANRRIVAIDPMSGRTRILPGGPSTILAIDFSANGRTMAFSGQTPTTLPEVYRSPMGAVRPIAVTEMSRQIRGWLVGTAELVRWKSQDGAEIEGVLHKPAGFDPAKKYPLFVVIHGGPTGIDFPVPVTGYVYPVTQWLARGALVLRPNYRGSAGYGEKFRALNVRNLGVGDAWDVLSGVDHLARQGMVDTTRMAAMGWSQGGYISAFLATTSNRFKAISVGAGISDWMTYYVNTDIHPFTRQYLQATPWDDPEIYAKTSPITYIKQAKTPTLIQHGELDRRVPIANAYQLFQGLQDVGVPTQLIVYKGFGHGIDKPKEQLAALWHNWQWFGKHIWGEEVKLPLEVSASRN
ncbi:MAG: S9 family peptidase [Gemmatimonadetes bacterium]|jgi:dipeptidyl aminopeptidase/acylaminoacyl peptidase|nr:S9 family peptidase [Gemmatimonadota bacterium]